MSEGGLDLRLGPRPRRNVLAQGVSIWASWSDEDREAMEKALKKFERACVDYVTAERPIVAWLEERKPRVDFK